MNRQQRDKRRERNARESREKAKRYAGDIKSRAHSVIPSMRESIEKVRNTRERLIKARDKIYFPLFSGTWSLSSPDATYIRAIEAYRNGMNKQDKDAILAKVREIVSTLDRDSLEYYATLFYYNELVGKRADAQKKELDKLSAIERRSGIQAAFDYSTSAYKAHNVEGEYLAEEIRDILLKL